MSMRACAIAFGAGVAAAAMGQVGASRVGGPGMVPGMFGGGVGEAEITPAGPVVASLSYDGTSSWGFKGQDFESVFDIYDVYVCDIFSISADASLGEFRSAGFGNGNPDGVTDVVVEIYGIDQLGELCDDGVLPEFVLRSSPGTGFWDGSGFVSDFGGQCLASGEYILRWAGELEFGVNGQMFFFGQAGEHDNGGGSPEDGFQSNPGNGMGFGPCFDVVDGGLGLPTGVNFVLSEGAGDCEPCSQDPTGCGDWDGDGDSDGDDFFAYLDDFASGDGCADLDGDGDIDSPDMFFFLDRFVRAC